MEYRNKYVDGEGLNYVISLLKEKFDSDLPVIDLSSFNGEEIRKRIRKEKGIYTNCFFKEDDYEVEYRRLASGTYTIVVEGSNSGVVHGSEGTFPVFEQTAYLSTGSNTPCEIYKRIVFGGEAIDKDVMYGNDRWTKVDNDKVPLSVMSDYAISEIFDDVFRVSESGDYE